MEVNADAASFHARVQPAARRPGAGTYRACARRGFGEHPGERAQVVPVADAARQSGGLLLREADAYEAEEYETEGDHCVAIVTDARSDTSVNGSFRPRIEPGTRIPIPNTKMKWDQGNPTIHGYVFIGSNGALYCYVAPAERLEKTFAERRDVAFLIINGEDYRQKLRDAGGPLTDRHEISNLANETCPRAGRRRTCCSHRSLCSEPPCPGFTSRTLSEDEKKYKVE
jgi:hypothetical protein